VSLTINRIAAVAIPVIFGFIWIQSHAAVFLMGTVMAIASVMLARLVLAKPADGLETCFAQ